MRGYAVARGPRVRATALRTGFCLFYRGGSQRQQHRRGRRGVGAPRLSRQRVADADWGLWRAACIRSAGCDLYCRVWGTQPGSRTAPPAPVLHLHRDFASDEDTCVVPRVQRSHSLYKQRAMCTVVALSRTPTHRRTPRIGLCGISTPISLHYTATPRNPLLAFTGRSINISAVSAPHLALTATKLEPHHHSAITL
ncbi:hypothetical protein NDU88_009949 [Pleurodeles waltl]|uniref:Uncharacterized protein n=1 Tax=Pleurodeles waltl TaxID=8319 RepID=A0AAV7PXE7_PLEWA|nr:hypothetical protein NDU88_009949 [Pleurodeles waltl]